MQKDCVCMLLGGMELQTTDILNELANYLRKPVIYADQSSDKPPYPYIAMKEMISYIPQAGLPSVENKSLETDIKQIATSQPTMSLSITAYSKDFVEVAELSLKAHDW